MFVSFSGSGKSYLAKMLRDLEVENGDDAPRIHSMDDYFMTEVEKVRKYKFFSFIFDQHYYLVLYVVLINYVSSGGCHVNNCIFC